MTIQLTTEQVWQAIEKELFAVIGLAEDEEMVAGSALIEVTPEKDFITYGVGIPLLQMRHPEKARGRAPVAYSGGATKISQQRIDICKKPGFLCKNLVS